MFTTARAGNDNVVRSKCHLIKLKSQNLMACREKIYGLTWCKHFLFFFFSFELKRLIARSLDCGEFLAKKFKKNWSPGSKGLTDWSWRICNSNESCRPRRSTLPTSFHLKFFGFFFFTEKTDIGTTVILFGICRWYQPLNSRKQTGEIDKPQKISMLECLVYFTFILLYFPF